MTEKYSRAEAKDGLNAILWKYIYKHRDFLESERFFEDLAICGDDASETLDDVHARFGTTFEGLRFNVYFTNDPDGSVERIGWRLFGLRDKNRKPITVGHVR